MVGCVTCTITMMDEYQLQVPDSLVRWKKFENGLKDKTKVEDILRDVDKSKKLKEKGKPYKSAIEICNEYGIEMDQLKAVINSHSQAIALEGGKFSLSGNVRVLDDGSLGRAYTRAGELMVRCIEDAYKLLDFKVPITGSYLIGKDWAETH